MYTIHYEYFDNIESHINVSKLSILTLIVGLVSLILVFMVNEVLHWQEIRYFSKNSKISNQSNFMIHFTFCIVLGQMYVIKKEQDWTLELNLV